MSWRLWRPAHGDSWPQRSWQILAAEHSWRLVCLHWRWEENFTNQGGCWTASSVWLCERKMFLRKRLFAKLSHLKWEIFILCLHKLECFSLFFTIICHSVYILHCFRQWYLCQEYSASFQCINYIAIKWEFLQWISYIITLHRVNILVLKTYIFLSIGSATIYNTQLSEIMNMEEIRNYTGFCPQFNIYFDFLTVRENLRLFAKIKGIPPKEVEQEVDEHIRIDDFGNNVLSLLLFIFLFDFYSFINKT